MLFVRLFVRETQLSTWSALSRDWEVNWIVPWSLGEIGDKSAIPPLIETLGDNSPDMRVLAIYALEKLKSKEALPQLRALLDDDEKIHFDGLGTVAEAARAAIATLGEIPAISPNTRYQRVLERSSARPWRKTMIFTIAMLTFRRSDCAAVPSSVSVCERISLEALTA